MNTAEQTHHLPVAVQSSTRPQTTEPEHALERAARLNRLLAHIGETRALELEAMRAEFNRPSLGAWGVLFLPGYGWVAVCGRAQTVWAANALQLRDRLLPLISTAQRWAA